MPKGSVGGFGHTLFRCPLSCPTHTLTTTTDSTAHYMITCVLSDSLILDTEVGIKSPGRQDL